jgi:hypothetical protein
MTAGGQLIPSAQQPKRRRSSRATALGSVIDRLKIKLH